MAFKRSEKEIGDTVKEPRNSIMSDINKYGPNINEKFREFSFPDMNNTWSDMKAILDRELPEKRKRRFGFWFNSYTIIPLFLIGVSIAVLAIYNYRNFPAITQNNTASVVSSDTEKALPTHRDTVFASEALPENEGEKEITYKQEPVTITPAVSGAIEDTASSTATAKNIQSVTSPLVKQIQSDTKGDEIKTQIPDRAKGTTVPNASIAGESKSNDLKEEGNKNTTALQTNKFIHPATSNQTSDAVHKAMVLVPVKQTAIPKPNWKLPDSLSLTQLISAAKDSLAVKTVKGSVKKKGWVVGASVNYNLPVSNQEMSTVSINGKKNALIDFLPSLYAQYHLNQKWYIESSFEFSSPQYTSIHKLASEKKYPDPNHCQENAIWLNKLYYLNLPFSVHFRPLPNLNIGTGIQYSYLRRSLFEDEAATWEKSSSGWAKTSSAKNIKVKTNTPARAKSNNGRGTPTNPGSTTTPTKIDTVAQTLRSSDWRMLFDVNYSWKRINMGCRFNFGLNNYINTKSGNTILAVKDKNQAFQLYLRYDIFDKRKKISHTP